MSFTEKFVLVAIIWIMWYASSPSCVQGEVLFIAAFATGAFLAARGR